MWATTTLRPYIEGQKFTVRTDHDALRWLLTISDATGRLMRWRLRLSEFDFAITYRPGLVHQVPDALSRVLTPRGVEPNPVDDEVPTYGDHEPVLVTTRARSAAAQQRLDSARAEVGVEGNDALPAGIEDAVPDDTLGGEIDDFDVAIAEDESPELIAEGPLALTLEELVEAQKADEFSQTVLHRQSERSDSRFFEDHQGLLRRKHPTDPACLQIVLPETLRPRLLRLAHYAKLAGHPGQTRMYETLRRVYYWLHMAADIHATVRNCGSCARNRLKLRKHTQPLQLFPATGPLQSLAIDLLGPLTKTKRGNRFLLVITDRFTKLTQVVPLRRIDAYTVAVAFTVHWVFHYGPPESLLSDNGAQFAAKFFHCQHLHLHLPSGDEWAGGEV